MILPDTDAHAVIERAVHNYFAYKTDLNHREFRNLLRKVGGLEVPGTKVLQESLTICGWVAMDTYL
jgi:hypothetical protein